MIKMEDIQFQNMDMWRGSSSGKFGLNFKQIVLMHINRCVLNGSVEWHGGYWQQRQKEHWTEKYYIPNSRDVYNNSVRMLRALLLGYYDKDMRKADEDLQKEFDELYETYENEENKAKLREFHTEKVGLYIRMFEELIKLSKRLNFFEEESSEDEL